MRPRPHSLGRRNLARLRSSLQPRRMVTLLLLGFTAFLFLDTLFPLPPRKPYSPQVLASDGSLLRAYLSPDDKWRMRVTLDQVPAELPQALVAKEDRWFWWHPGVNPLAVARALVGNAASGERKSGASTITMQLARMLEPKPRTLWGKVQEAFRAMQLEWHHSKTEILEMYMSHLPYGGNVEGVAAASYLYFARPPSRLSLAQCMLLTVIPNRPNSLRPDSDPTAALQARNRWLHRFRDMGLFPASQLEDALVEAIPGERKAIGFTAPQFCQRTLRHSAQERVVTTLDPAIQQTVQQLLANHVRRLKPSGITNGAVLVVDNSSMSVRAYCASADFADKAAAGEVDGIQAVRSPGSTLKPFIYATAFDQGLLTPKMKVLDIPTEFSDFSPLNYDRTFRGEITAEEALRHSLNLPAVRLLNQVGLQGFIRALRQAGFRSVSRHHQDLGLSLALGGCGATLEELVRVYAALANGGRLRPLRYLAGPAPETEGIRLCSPEAAYMVTDILAGLQRPDLPPRLLSRSKLPKVAWKTGTSFGRRDAWSIGYNPRYTVGIWMGNMDGRPVLEMSGNKTAVPLLLDIFSAIDYGGHKSWFTPPTHLHKREVCAHTGLLPRPSCAQLTQDLAIPGVSPHTTCTRDRLLFVNAEGTVQYCTACLPAQGYIRRSYPVISPELALWMERVQLPYPQPPIHNPHCVGVFHGVGPSIHSPVKGQTYFVEKGQALLLQAAPDPGTSMHYWFANAQFLGACVAGGKFFFTPPAGEIDILCMDDRGRKGSLRVMVERL